MYMKKYIFLAASVLTLASCSSDDFIGEGQGNTPSAANTAISFSGSAGKITRADNQKEGEEAAKALGNKFVVFGTKTTGYKVQTVYDNYTVKYANSKWDYVGTFGEKTQTIKYWDFSASQYDFIAYSVGTGNATAEKIKDNIYTLTGNIENLAKCYIANKVTVQKNNFKQDVKITYHSLGSKVNLGLYETIPGYSVKEVKFYKNGSETSPSATAPTLYATSNTIPGDNDQNQMKVEYKSGESEPTVTFNSTTMTSELTFGMLQMTESKLGTDKTQTSKPTTPTTVLAAKAGALTLKVDYTLVSDDGSQEEINIKGATATVPAAFTNWLPNHAYTYIFKISDSTNGTTGSGNDPSGLFPINFDAVVAETEIGNQETITIINKPSITTYAKESNGNEYKAGNIYVSVGSGAGNLTLPTENNSAYNCALYTVKTTGSITATEALVEACLTKGIDDTTPNQKTLKLGNNSITVTEATGLSITDKIDASDTSDNKEISGKFAKFTASSNITYAFEYTEITTDGNNGNPTTAKYYKVIKVQTGN